MLKFYYFGAHQAVRELFEDREYVRLRAEAQDAGLRDGAFSDWWSGELSQRYEKHIPALRQPTTCVLEAGGDDYQPFVFSQWSTMMLVLRPIDIAPQHRSRKDFHRLVALGPGPKQRNEVTNAILSLLVTEMLSLRRKNVLSRDPQIFTSAGGSVQDVVLAGFHADTPARCHYGGYNGVAAYVNDYRSLFTSYRYAGVNANYSMGYFEPAPMADLRGVGSVITRFANDETAMLTDPIRRELFQMVANKTVTSQLAGCKASSPFLRLPYWDTVFGFHIPIYHALFLGVVKNFISLLLPKAGHTTAQHAMPTQYRKLIEARSAYVARSVPHDVGKAYRCIVQEKHMYTMEHWAHFLFIYSPLVFEDTLLRYEPLLARGWERLRRGCAHFLDPQRTAIDHGENKKFQAYIFDFARACEERGMLTMGTMQLRLVAVHLARQEVQCGNTAYLNELWVERFVGHLKKRTKHIVTSKVEGSVAKRELILRQVRHIRRTNPHVGVFNFSTHRPPRTHGPLRRQCEAVGIVESYTAKFKRAPVALFASMHTPDGMEIHSALYRRMQSGRSSAVLLQATSSRPAAVCVVSCFAAFGDAEDASPGNRHALVQLLDPMPNEELPWVGLEDWERAGMPDLWVSRTQVSKQWISIDEVQEKVMLVPTTRSIGGDLAVRGKVYASARLKRSALGALFPTRDEPLDDE